MRKLEKSKRHLLLTLGPELIPSFFQLKRIQTFFLDGRPVDDVNSAIIKEGSTLSLSAAMPGLLGASLRKGSPYAAMRSEISHREEMKSTPSGEGTVVLKLFNLVTGELGPTFLKGGVWIKGKALGEFFGRQSDRFWAGCKTACLDGEKVDLKKLAEIGWPDEPVVLHVRDL